MGSESFYCSCGMAAFTSSQEILDGWRELHKSQGHRSLTRAAWKKMQPPTDPAYPLRVLAIERGQDKDSFGRGVGADWLLADLGGDPDNKHYYVTTNRIHASEVGDLRLGPADLAKLIVETVNQRFAERVDDEDYEDYAGEEYP